MSGTAISLIVFAVLLGGAVLGAVLRRFLPEQRLDDDSKQVINLGTGLIGTIAALVLGLLIAAGKNAYDAQSSQVKQLTADIVLLDLMLDQYGQASRPARQLIRDAIPPLVDQIWRLSPLVVTVQLLLSLSAAAAVFLILGMSEPFSGPFEISRAPLQHALAPLGP